MRPLLVAVACAALLPLAAAAQGTPLRIQGPAGSVSVEASPTEAPAYAARAVEALGGSILPMAGGVRLLLFGDTLEFQATSPFFRTGSGVHHLAYPAHLVDGALHLPEQFFIAWLPTAYPERVAYRGGVLQVRGAGVSAGSAEPARAGVDAPPDTPPAGTPAAAPSGPGPVGSRDARVVILDAGHGGRDPGKVGPGRLAEKQVTLAIAQRLGRILRERGFEVHYTRTVDTLIALVDRPHLANELKGFRPRAVFVSIHANAWRTAQPRGFETYFLAEATTEDERRVAEMENAALAYEDDGAGSSTRDAILSSLRNEYWVRASAELAATVQRRLAAFHPGPNRGVKRAEFVVLVGAVMPAVLVETGFISHPEEARLLGSAAFQDKLGWALADALEAFFEAQEPLWAGG
ncbi:MAG: N-acetylmuramoyl-L-alanine amidase [Gemmatimonadota bacterium]